MPKIRRPPSEDHANTAAVDVLVRELDEAGLVQAVDGPVIQRARSLAQAVDRNPDSSQLWIAYEKALDTLRTKVESEEHRRASAVMWRLHTGCDNEVHRAIGGHCARCCERWDAWETAKTATIPPRSMFEGTAAGKPVGRLTDEEYARRVLLKYLSQQPITQEPHPEDDPPIRT